MSEFIDINRLDYVNPEYICRKNSANWKKCTAITVIKQSNF